MGLDPSVGADRSTIRWRRGEARRRLVWAAASEVRPKTNRTKTTKTKPKAATKAASKPAPKVAKKEVAEKAKPDDVLGPEVVGEDALSEKTEKTPES